MSIIDIIKDFFGIKNKKKKDYIQIKVGKDKISFVDGRENKNEEEE